jgi:hypothetical protein
MERLGARSTVYGECKASRLRVGPFGGDVQGPGRRPGVCKRELGATVAHGRHGIDVWQYPRLRAPIGQGPARLDVHDACKLVVAVCRHVDD